MGFTYQPEPTCVPQSLPTCPPVILILLLPTLPPAPGVPQSRRPHGKDPGLGGEAVRGGDRSGTEAVTCCATCCATAPSTVYNCIPKNDFRGHFRFASFAACPTGRSAASSPRPPTARSAAWCWSCARYISKCTTHLEPFARAPASTHATTDRSRMLPASLNYLLQPT